MCKVKIWITYYVSEYDYGIIVDKVFDIEKKAKEYIKFKDQMTGDSWGYFDRELE